MDDKEFKEFWSWLLEEGHEHDAWWLYSWLSDQMEEWDQMPVCECGHRVTQTEKVWSKTGNHILEHKVTCADCGKLIETRDNRKSLIQAINEGRVMVKDLDILKGEVGLVA